MRPATGSFFRAQVVELFVALYVLIILNFLQKPQQLRPNLLDHGPPPCSALRLPDAMTRCSVPSFATEDQPVHFDLPEHRIVGPTGELPVLPNDLVVSRLAMLIEGQCEGLGAAKAADKLGLSKQRYFQLLKLYREQVSPGLRGHKPGPKRNYVRTDEVVRQVIRHRFLDPDATVDVIAQKLRQAGFQVSVRSVVRVIEEYGLQKKTLSLPPGL